MMSATVQPLLKSLTGLVSPCMTGPIAMAPVDCCTACTHTCHGQYVQSGMYVQYGMYVVHTVCKDWQHRHAGRFLIDGKYWAIFNGCMHTLLFQKPDESVSER